MIPIGVSEVEYRYGTQGPGANPMINDEAMKRYKDEYKMLRNELHDLKSCQLQFIMLSVTATGVLLGLGKYIINPDADGIVYLSPLIIILPVWFIFFDKSLSVTRVVGYLRVLERIIYDKKPPKVFYGWERSLHVFRENEIRQSLRTMIKEYVEGVFGIQKKNDKNIKGDDEEIKDDKIIKENGKKIKKNDQKINLVDVLTGFTRDLINKGQFHYHLAIYVTFFMLSSICLILALSVFIEKPLVHQNINITFIILIDILLFTISLASTAIVAAFTFIKLYYILSGFASYRNRDAAWHKIIFDEELKDGK